MMSMSLQFAMPAAHLHSGQLQTAQPEPIGSDAAWRQVLARDPGADFFYAVTTTGVFCRPDCASKRPLRANVRFFRTAEAAQAAGFRACARCKPEAPRSNPVEQMRTYLEAHRDRAVPLAELARLVRLSPFTVQRLFKRQMGVSPLEYQRALRAGALRGALKQGNTVTDAIYSAGFGSSSRAYEGASLGMTPARFAQGGRGERIGYTAARTPFGWMIVGATERGLCWLSLAGSKEEAQAALRAEFPAATLERDAALAQWIDQALASVRAARSDNALLQNQAATELDLRGTVFQLRVWRALRQIPHGQTRSYSQLALEMGEPKATRAVARACALNRVALLVPCHRVVGAAGALTGYRWGLERKRAILEVERKRAVLEAERKRAPLEAERARR
jgi:AraC family transcriptional regulator, regulatory protein of adaptative response / methylated-DNA-[protein]-cysteine methyltransferase